MRPDRVLQVSPADITYKCLLPGSALRNRGCGWVLDGDWDTLKHPFVNDCRYGAVHDVLVEGAQWQDTDEYAREAQCVEGGYYVRHCRTRDELDRRYQERDNLVAAIRRDGYLSHKELRRRRTPESLFGRQDEISVAISRHGDILFRDGGHRLAIAKVLGVPSLPVEVELRHTGWMEFRREIERYALAHGGQVPQPLPHPDLEDIPAGQSCTIRLRRIVPLLPAGGTVIDFAPGWGCVCTRLEREGVACVALEPSPDAAWFLHRLRRACCGGFEVIRADELDGRAERPSFHSGLLLNDGLSAAERMTAADALAAAAAMELGQLFVEPTAFVDGVSGAEDPAGADALLSRLARETALPECQRLGWTVEAGPLYRLRRKPEGRPARLDRRGTSD